MKIFNKYKREIINLQTWEKAFIEVDRAIHWKEGRSAHSLASFYNPENNRGIAYLNDIVKYIPEVKGLVSWDDAFIEFESKFDSYRGNGRMHDLAVWGHSNDQEIFVGIEAKVDETLGPTIGEAWAEAEKRYEETNHRSNGINRIRDLINQYCKGIDNKTINALRYQLLHYLAGSISQAMTSKAIVAVMPVVVFHTGSFNKHRGDENKRDYESFFRTLGFSSMQINDSLMFRKDFGDCVVYSIYSEIKL